MVVGTWPDVVRSNSNPELIRKVLEYLEESSGGYGYGGEDGRDVDSCQGRA